MKDTERIIVGHWKKVLANYVDPMALMAALPLHFPYGNSAHADVYRLHDRRHEAVNCALETIIHSDLTLDNLIDAIRESGNEWLATLIKGDVPDSDIETEMAKTEELKNIRSVLTLIAPHIRETIQAIDVADALRCQNVITELEFERVESKAKMDGNSFAVIELLSHLVRKTTSWLPGFVNILRECNYDAKLIHSLENLFDVSSCSASAGKHTEKIIVREGERPDVKAKPPLSGAKNAAKFSGTGHQIPWNPECHNQTFESYDDHASHLLSEANGKNVVICIPTGHVGARVTAHVIEAHGKDMLRSKPKIAVVVDRPAELSVMEALLKLRNIRIASLVEDNDASPSEVFEKNTVIIMTLQVFVNSLNDGSIFKYELTLMIFDNCHTTYDIYKNVLSYTKSKESHANPLPQVIGLLTTANMEHSAVDQVLDICAGIDAMGGIISIPAELESAELCSLSDPFTKCLCETIHEQMGILARLNLAADTDIDGRFEGNQKNETNPKNVTCWSSDIQACIEQMQIFNKALDIHIKVCTADALNYLRQKKQQNWSLTSAVELAKLADAAFDKLTECASENCDWKRVATEIKNAFARDPDSRVMLIVEEEQHVQKTKDHLNRDETLMKIPAESLSQNRHLPEMNSAYEPIIANLQTGVTKILVCTPGTTYSELGGMKWNLLICYDYSKNMLSKTKITGRALQKYGSKATDMLGGFSMALAEEAIGKVQEMFHENQDSYKEELTYRQYQMLTRMSPCHDLPMSSSFIVECFKCKTYICNGEDVVKLGTNHTCIDRKSFEDKVQKQKYDDGGTESKEGLHCKECKSKLGIFANVKRLYIPQLHPSALRFKHKGPNRSNDITASKKKWATVKIKFREVDDDLVMKVWD